MAKRIVICADGTWNSPREKYVTNVLKIARGIRPRDRRGVEQVVFYDWGVGTFDSSDRVFGGAVGKGINRNIQDAYRFLVHNYDHGDEIFCLGFSRGAYTVRSLVGLIRNAGLLHKQHSDQIRKAYKLYRSPSKPDSSQSQEFRERYAREARIEFLGVWDTVGALGIPLGVFGQHNEEKYAFHDTRISSIVEHAYHALAIDEKRHAFRPTLWESDPSRTNTAQQWFAGVHSDVGGGYADSGLSDRTLTWMADHAEACGLALDRSYLDSLIDERSRHTLHNSYTGAYRAADPYLRSIGTSNYDETIHASTLAYRNEHASYRPPNLEAYLGYDTPAERSASTRRRRTAVSRIRGR